MCNDGDHMYCGTTTGDILFVNVDSKLIKDFGPQKGKFSQVCTLVRLDIVLLDNLSCVPSQGISTIKVLPSDDILLGTGAGTVAVLSPKTYKTVRLVRKVYW